MTGGSYRTILRSSSIIGGAQVINVAVSILKMKVVAVLLGPAGVGLAGLYLALIQTASGVASLGIGTVGTRQIAAAQAEGRPEAVGAARRALFWGTLILALAGAALFWAGRGPIAQVVLGDPARAEAVGWLAPGVALTVAAGAQGALLTGLRRVGDLARISIGTGTIGAILGVAALWAWGEAGILAMVLVVPVTSFALGHLYVARLGRPAGPALGPRALWQSWRVMVPLGLAFMISGVVTMLGFLAARAMVQQELGLEALGQFQAAWAIGSTYLGFVLGAMGTDYFPRLTAALPDPEQATRLVNEQTEVALLLCAPVLVGMLGAAPWVIRLLYSPEFGPAVEILRWQLLADFLKVMSWPLGFILLAAGAGRTFVLTETAGMAVYLAVIAIALPQLGVVATGMAFLALYLVYLPLVWWLGGRRIGFRWTRAVRAQALAILAAALAVEAAARWSDAAGLALGTALAAGLTLWALLRLASKAGAAGRLGRIAALGERVRGWLIRA